MKLIIVSGQEGADVESLFEKVISENGYVYQYAPKMVFPENSMLLRHPRALYNNVRNDGEDIISEMNPETAKYEYVDGIFDTIDKALDELLWG